MGGKKNIKEGCLRQVHTLNPIMLSMKYKTDPLCIYYITVANQSLSYLATAVYVMQIMSIAT
jgi:hypothetical protein